MYQQTKWTVLSLITLFLILSFSINSSAQTIWGNVSGEGDFNGGTNGWVGTEDSNCPGFDLWRWSPDGTATDGAFFAGGGISEAPTASNGAMAFDSDFYDNNGDGNNLGGGDCPAIHIGELISPTIDLASISSGISGVSLRFHQATRRFQSDYIVSYSNDDGDTWNDITINEDFEVNSPHLNEWEEVLLPNANFNSSTFRIKFRFVGNYYYWIIDDVQLVVSEANNLALSTDFFAIAPNAQTPVSQVEPFSHLTDVSNLGAAEQSNVNVNVTIRDDANNTQVFSDDNPYGPIAPASTIGNQPFPNAFTPNGLFPKSYTATYEVTGNTPEPDLSDNSVSYSMITSDTVFAKDFGGSFAVRPADANWDPAEPHSWAYGNYYRIVDGENWDASSVSFGIGNASDLIDQIIFIGLHRWLGDFNGDGDANVDERELVGFSIYVINGTESESDVITLELQDIITNQSGVNLESDGDYLLMVEYTTSSIGEDLEIVVGESNYNAMTALSGLNGNPRYASLIAIGNPSDQTFSTNAFTGLVPTVRLNISANELTPIPFLADVACLGECSGSIDLTISGGEPEYTFLWSGPDGFSATTKDIADLCSGAYEVIVTDSEGSTQMGAYIVSEPILMTENTTVADASCFQQCDGTIDLIVEGGAGAYTYIWSNGESSQNLTNLCPGDYEVTITDNNGCTITSMTQVSEPLEILTDFQPTLVPCVFPCESSIDLSVTNGAAPLSFGWFDNNGDLLTTDEDLTNVCPGIYMVIITDTNGCVVEESYEILDPDFPQATISSQNLACFEACDGAIDLTMEGGMVPYTYSWSDGLPAQEDQTDLCAGIYTVTIADALGCMNVVEVEITQPTALEVTVTEVSNPTCFGLCDGMIELELSGGTGPYSIGGNTDNLCAGDYSLTITDAEGCISSFSFGIDETPMVSVSIDSIGDEIDEMMNGFVDITPGNGVLPFSYNWMDMDGNTVSSEEDPSGLSAGTYQVEITDADGCLVLIEDIIIDNIVAISQVELNNAIEIFPNPTSGIIQIKLNTSSPLTGDLELYDFTGRLIQASKESIISGQLMSLDLSQYSDGIYTLKIRVEDTFVVEKIIKHTW